MKGFPRTATVRRTAAAAALAATLLTAGCAQASPDVAAYVGRGEISTQQVDDAVAAVSSTVQPGQQVSTDAVLGAMIQGEVAAQIAARRGITITDTDRDAAIRTTNLASLLAVPAAQPLVYDLADSQIVAKKIGAAGYLAELKKVDVKLNPRYGVLDPQQKTVLPESGSLSRPATPAAP